MYRPSRGVPVMPLTEAPIARQILPTLLPMAPKPSTVTLLSSTRSPSGLYLGDQSFLRRAVSDGMSSFAAASIRATAISEAETALW